MTGQAGPSDRWAFFPFTRGLIHAQDPRLTRVGSDPGVGLTRVLAETATSALAMFHHVTLAEIRDIAHVRSRTPRRGTDLRVVVHPTGLVRCPLASSILPTVRSGPAAQPLAVVDGRRAVLRDPVGDAWWVTSDPHLVQRASETVARIWDVAEPVLAPHEPPPFTPRMVEVAQLLLRGATDRQIARELRVSERTVSAEVSEITRRLGATSRANAVARISGL